MAPPRLYHNMALSLDECIQALEFENKPTFPSSENGSLWCNATWDTFLCWPAIPANTSFALPCPPLRGLMPDRFAVRSCHASGLWMNRDPNDFNRTSGWTNFTDCLLPHLKDFMKKLSTEDLQTAQQIASNARKIEFVGLTLSLVSLIVAITIFSVFRRLQVFRNQMHRQLMIVILLNVITRLILYIDLSYGRDFGTWVQASEISVSIHSTQLICEAFYILLEYLKSVAFAFMFMEGFYLHNTVVVQVFQETEPSLWKYICVGWGVPVVHISVWVFVMLKKRSFQLEKCLGEYYMQPEYWIMDGIRLAELVINVVFLLNVVRVLWTLVRETQVVSEFVHLKKSVKAALMLIPLLGIPNIMQTIPYIPTRDNLKAFAVFTYVASFFFMFQGFMVSVLYCFTNREVVNVVKGHWSRYRLRHTSADTLRRGSRAASLFYHGGGGGGPGFGTEANGNNDDELYSQVPNHHNNGHRFSALMANGTLLNMLNYHQNGSVATTTSTKANTKLDPLIKPELSPLVLHSINNATGGASNNTNNNLCSTPTSNKKSPSYGYAFLSRMRKLFRMRQ